MLQEAMQTSTNDQYGPRMGEEDLDNDDCMSQSSIKTNNNVVLLWDMLKAKFKRSEQEELCRIIGRDLIQKCEDLRDEYSNYYEIYLELQEQESSEKQISQENIKKSSSLFSTGGNQKFLNQELLFFIESLQKKAIDSGLDENSLIPKRDDKDKKIFEYLNQNVIQDQLSSRPQSAMTKTSSPSKMSSTFHAGSNPMADPMGLDSSMRSSFYSTRNGGFFNNKNGIVESLKVKNVLELSSEQIDKIKQIRVFIQDQADGLKSEIQELEQLLLDHSNPEPVKTMAEIPSQKDLKDYSNKLQNEFLKSNESIKVQKIMNVPTKNLQRFVVSEPLGKIPSKPPLKLAASHAASIKVSAASIDKTSPQKQIVPNSDGKIVKLKLKRADSQSKQIKVSETASTSAVGGKIKLKIRPSSSLRVRQEVQKSPVPKQPKDIDLYGFDASFLEDLGLTDIIKDLDKPAFNKNSTPTKQSDHENMTFEELRLKYDIDGNDTKASKLRGICKQYNAVYDDKNNN